MISISTQMNPSPAETTTPTAETVAPAADAMGQPWSEGQMGLDGEGGPHEGYHGAVVTTPGPISPNDLRRIVQKDGCPCGCGHVLDLQEQITPPTMPYMPTVALLGEEKCPWWAALNSLHGEERCPWFISPQPDGNGATSSKTQDPELGEPRENGDIPAWVRGFVDVFGPEDWHGEEVEGLAPDLWERAAMEWARWRRDWLNPPRSILGEEFWPHWMEPGGWVPVWFPTRYPSWLLPEEAGRWRNHWIYVRGYWMEAAAIHPDDVVLRGTRMAWVSMQGWAQRKEEFHILVWDEELPLLNGYGDWLEY